MKKIIIHNKTNLPLEEIMDCASQTVECAITLLENVGDMRAVEFYGNVNKGEIIKRKTCYTIVIS